jgi:hypothetical protein
MSQMCQPRNLPVEEKWTEGVHPAYLFLYKSLPLQSLQPSVFAIAHFGSCGREADERGLKGWEKS